MGERGPKKGEGGRPRVSNPKPREDGYKRVTKGPVGDGTQMYEHRAKKGLAPGSGSLSGKEGVVDHKNRKRGDNSSDNLRVVSKKENRKNTKKG